MAIPVIGLRSKTALFALGLMDFEYISTDRSAMFCYMLVALERFRPQFRDCDEMVSFDPSGNTDQGV